MKELYEAVLFVGNIRFGIGNCIGARLVRGRQQLSGLEVQDISEAPIYYYLPPHRDQYLVWQVADPRRSVHMSDLIDKSNQAQLDDYCFIQFIGISGEARAEVIKHIPDIPNLAGQGSPDLSSPRSTHSWDSSSRTSDSLQRPHLQNNDYNDPEDDMPPRCCPRTCGDRSAPPGTHGSGDEVTPEEASFFLQTYGTRMLEIPSSLGWESWTSEEQRQHELCTYFADLLPKNTDSPVLNDLSPEEAQLLDEFLENTHAQRRPPAQITHATYLSVKEAQHTEPVFLAHGCLTDTTVPEDSVGEDSDYLEAGSIAFEDMAAYSHELLHEQQESLSIDPDLHRSPQLDHTPVVVVETFLVRSTKKPFKSKSEFTKKLTIEKELNNLSPDEVAKHRAAVLAADLKELKQLFDLGTFKRIKRRDAHNIVDVRWVRKWKKDPTTGEKFVKSRLTVRGFKDLCQDMLTYAGTATRWAQRLIVALAVLLDLPMFTIDVTGAFAKGLNWEELSALTGETLRQVQFELTRPEDVALIRQIKGFEDFNPTLEVLDMVKAIYGLKDAPRAWRMRLHQILVEAGLSQLRNEKELYVMHEALRQPPIPCGDRSAPPGTHREAQLRLAATAHVDDLKCIGSDEAAASMIATVEKAVGKVTLLKDNFEHCGIKHETTDTAITMHQNHYAAQLRPIDESLLGNHKDHEEVKDFCVELVTLFMSLLGGLAWLVLTRLDICIYVQCMQRHAQSPRVEDVRKLNRLLRWVQKRPAGIVYMRHPQRKNKSLSWRLTAISDSAFRSLEDNTTGLALRGYVILLTVKTSEHPGGECVILDYGTKKHKRVNRSTFAAELNAAVDTIDIATIVQFTLEEIFNPQCSTPEAMQKLFLSAKLMFPLELIIDAKAVYDAIVVPEYNMPTEATLVNHLHSVREQVRDGRIARLWWIDTRDMVADGLNKGGLPRDPILHLCERGKWILSECGISHSTVS